MKHASEYVKQTQKHASRLMATLIQSQGGRVVSLDFINAKGEIHTINGRLGVRKHTKGTGRKQAQGVLTLYKMNAASRDGGGSQHYRSVRLESILSLRAGGIVIAQQTKGE